MRGNAPNIEPEPERMHTMIPNTTNPEDWIPWFALLAFVAML